MTALRIPVNSHMGARRHGRSGGLLLCAALMLLMALAGLCVGSTMLHPGTVWQAIWHFDPSSNQHLLVRHDRIPRTLLGLLVGCALGLSGVVMQALIRNPLAEPGILGVNAGAACAIVLAIALLGITAPAGYVLFGLLGAALAGLGVYLLGGLRRGHDPVRLVLAGAALSMVLLAITQIITVNSPDQVFDHFRHWGSGSLRGRGYAVLLPVAVLTAAGTALALMLGRALDIAALGQDLSRALGSRVGGVWLAAASAVVLLAGAATAAAGPINFIGLTAPHIARAIAGHGHRWLMPYAIVLSATLVLMADVLGRLVARPGEVGVGIMVALIGGPFFVMLVRRRRISHL